MQATAENKMVGGRKSAEYLRSKGWKESDNPAKPFIDGHPEQPKKVYAFTRHLPNGVTQDVYQSSVGPFADWCYTLDEALAIQRQRDVQEASTAQDGN